MTFYLKNSFHLTVERKAVFFYKGLFVKNIDHKKKIRVIRTIK